MIEIVRKMQSFSRIRALSRTAAAESRAERRAQERSLALYWRATLKTMGWTGPAAVIQASPRGLRLKSVLVPEPGVDVIVELLGVTPLRGEVRWIDGGRFGVELDRAIDVGAIMRAHRAATGARLVGRRT